MTGRKTFGVLAIARRHPVLFGKLTQGLAALLTCAVVTACGGGAAASPFERPSPPATVPVEVTKAPAEPPCVPRVVTVALAGDSTQFGIDGAVINDSDWVASRAVHNPGAELQAKMDEQFGVGAVIVTDMGIPGTVAGDAGRPAITADVISPNYGLNDARYGVSAAAFMSDMLSMHPTLIETPFPRMDGDPLLPVEQSYLDHERASGIPLADVNAYVRSLPNWQQYFPLPYSGHATDALYKLVIDNVLAPAVAAQVMRIQAEVCHG